MEDSYEGTILLVYPYIYILIIILDTQKVKSKKSIDLVKSDLKNMIDDCSLIDYRNISIFNFLYNYLCKRTSSKMELECTLLFRCNGIKRTPTIIKGYVPGYYVFPNKTTAYVDDVPQLLVLDTDDDEIS